MRIPGGSCLDLAEAPHLVLKVKVNCVAMPRSMGGEIDFASFLRKSSRKKSLGIGPAHTEG